MGVSLDALAWADLLALVANLPATSRFKSMFDPANQMTPTADTRPVRSASEVRAGISALFDD